MWKEQAHTVKSRNRTVEEWEQDKQVTQPLFQKVAGTLPFLRWCLHLLCKGEGERNWGEPLLLQPTLYSLQEK